VADLDSFFLDIDILSAQTTQVPMMPFLFLFKIHSNASKRQIAYQVHYAVHWSNLYGHGIAAQTVKAWSSKAVARPRALPLERPFLAADRSPPPSRALLAMGDLHIKSPHTLVYDAGAPEIWGCCMQFAHPPCHCFPSQAPGNYPGGSARVVDLA
jgi:hypothetical protein